jgi:cytochrome P450
LHPLSKYPGPVAWRAFRLPYIISLFRGELVHDTYTLHEKYGDVVRIAPNELSYTKTQAWADIHCPRAGHQLFPRNPSWWGDFPGRTPSIVSTPSQAAHTRMRKVLSYCFSMKAINSLEEVVQRNADLMISKFREQMKASESKETTVDIVEWYMFLTFDIFGELGFAESFECLKKSTLHPWVRTIFNYFRMGAYIAALRLYLGVNIDSYLMKIVPKETQRISTENYDYAVDKIHRRMNTKTERNDFMTYILRNNENGLSVPEIENNTNVLIVAGSETCSTMLAGTTNHLMKFPKAYQSLVHEIRSTFSSEADISFASLAPLPYLGAVIEEGLRMNPPFSSSSQHLVPTGGDTVCGEFLPEDVSSSNPTPPA